MKKSFKGQAALEFLTTYGWAIMMIGVMIGALAYFGILDVRKYVMPERCIFSSEIQCVDFQISIGPNANDDDVLNLVLKNNVGKTIGIVANDINVSGKGGIDAGCTSDAVSNWKNGEREDAFSLNDCDFDDYLGFKPGDKKKLFINIKYSKVGSSYIHQVNGEIFGTIQ